jgi:hypothetical protein
VAGFNIILNESADQEATYGVADEVRAEFGTATIAIGVGGVADNIKAGADFRLNADGTSPVLRSTKEAKKH